MFRGAGHPILGEPHRLSTQEKTRLWDTVLFANRPTWIADHKLRGATVFPAAGQIDLMLAAAQRSVQTERLIFTLCSYSSDRAVFFRAASFAS